MEFVTDSGPGSSRHPTRDIASGRPVFSLRVMPWADDVSGNRTKQYNPHINLYMQNINVPHKLRKQQFFTRFCSTSKHATSNEQFRAYLEDWYGWRFYMHGPLTESSLQWTRKIP